MAEKEYIEREAAIDFVKNNTPTYDEYTTMKCVERSLKTVPAVSTDELWHGAIKEFVKMLRARVRDVGVHNAIDCVAMEMGVDV